jgi:hypothetical protein
VVVALNHAIQAAEIPLLIVLLYPRPEARCQAAEALSRIGVASPAVLEALRANLLGVSRHHALAALATLLARGDAPRPPGAP